MVSRELVEYLKKKVMEAEREVEVWRTVLKIMEEKIEKMSEVKPSEKDIPIILEGLRWRRYPNGKGEWIYADQIPREVVELLKMKKREEIDGYIYMYKKLDRVEIISRRKVEEENAENSSKK
ncbi:MAG: hypothetical protein QXY26_09095 [Ignisphaera sp.]